MKSSVGKFLVMAVVFCAGAGFVCPSLAVAYNFGDFRSVTLVTKAWGSFAKGDLDGVLAYTNKCLELYAEEAQKMQASLKDYPQGDKDKIFAYWALNDVATALFIQGEAYRKANMNDEARQVYEKLIKEYSFGQTWDPQGWFWKPASAAAEKLAMLKSGSNVDFGGYTSSELTAKAWQALQSNDVQGVSSYVDKIVELYGETAKEMQSQLTEFPYETKEEIFSYWALNDVGTALFVKGEALKNDGKAEEAKTVFKKVIDEYYYAQCWDPQGWFWRPAEAAQEALDELEAI